MTTIYTAHLSSGDGLAASLTHTATHPSLLQVQFANGSYNSRLIALVPFSKGQLISPFLPHADYVSAPSYSTVQVDEDKHIELNSDLLYCNHSCDPNVGFCVDGDKEHWKAVAIKDIEKGDTLTFFYPSTEWQMAQPFACACNCGPQCLGQIDGAASIPAPTLARYHLNQHILRLKLSQLRQSHPDSKDEQELLQKLLERP
ncbi:hypothetical protein ACQY0O_007681 [Thecaphora frezii]